MLPRLQLLPDELAICKLPLEDSLPAWALSGAFSSVTREGDTLSVVANAASVPADVLQNGPWRAFQVAGPLDFALTGILAGIAVPLAEARITIFAVSTFDTDYVLVQADAAEQAATVLRRAGYTIEL